MKWASSVVRAVLVLGVFLLFFVSLELMGGSFKLMGRGFAEQLLSTTANPFVGLFIGILATSLVQSSSTVTSMVVALVAAGGLTVSGAIPIVMGANIGTSVTNTIVSLGHITRKDEFRRAIAGATVHDFFNLLVVAILFPLELGTRIITRISLWLADGLSGVGGAELLSPVKLVTKPISKAVEVALNGNGILVLVAGVVLLFVALRYLVIILKKIMLGRSERILHKYVFGAPPVALLVGVLLTVMVQSSSITTSVTIPLVAAGIVSVAQIFPFVLGANIGTTITALLAALVLSADGSPTGLLALEVAFAHMTFNVLGVVLFLPFRPLRNIPIALSEWLGTLAVKNRAYAFAYVGIVFFVIPLVVILATRGISTDFYGEPDRGDAEAVESVEPVPPPSLPVDTTEAQQ